MVADHRYDYLRNFHYYFGSISYPVYYLANLPVRLANKAYMHLLQNDLLETNNQDLRQENMRLRFRLQNYSAVLHENQHLRDLLQAPRHRSNDEVVIAELINKNSTPFKQRIVINKGSHDNAHIGQPILGINGIFGQITSVTPFSATAMLISDPDHAVMAQILRSGITALVVGVGNPAQLEIQYLPSDTNIRKGDVLLTTGFDDVYPPDYPIGYVTKVERFPRDAFATVFVRPYAELNRGREVLLVWKEVPPPVSKSK